MRIKIVVIVTVLFMTDLFQKDCFYWAYNFFANTIFLTLRTTKLSVETYQ